MDVWDIIECGFDTADETLNFGSRNLTSGENLFEACTLASLRCSQPRSSTINLKALTKAGKVLLSINSTIKIFANALCNELSLSLSFEEAIDTFCVTNDGKFLIVCLRNGLVHCIDTADENKVVFSKSVVDDNVMFVDCFIESYCDSSVCVLAAANDGRVFRVSFEFVGEKSDADEVVSDLMVDFDCFVKSVSFNGSVILADGEKMCVYDIPNENLQVCDGLSLKQIYPYNNSLFICIDELGNLIQICASTLLHININSDVNFESFIFIRNPLGISQLLALMKPPDSDQRNIQALTYPGLAPLFSLKTSEAIHLVQPEDVHDEYMYVQLLKSGGITEELRILQVVDSVPENCLKRMLRRGKFDKAFDFARTFSLDVVEIWKAKAESIVEKLVCSGDDVQELLGILKGIENEVGFKIKCCLAVFKYCEDLDDVRVVLNYGCHCLSDYTEAEDVEEELMEMVSEVMNRFETFVLIRKQGEYDVDWEEFSECNLFDLVCKALQKCSVEQANILNSRMDFTYLSKVDEQKIQAILSLLNNLSLDACASFLFSFLPITLTHAPGTLPLFVNWIQQKLFSIESGYRKGFPQNAVDFLDIFLQILNLDNVTNREVPDSLTRSAVHDLTFMMKTLKSLKSLKETYSIAIPLKEYLKSPRSLISTLLSVQLNERAYREFLSKFLCGFILENHFQPDEVFLEEICGLVKYQEQYWIKTVPLILQCINAIEVKLNAVVEILENADVPWCQAVQVIARNSLSYKHGLVKVIKEKIKNEPNQVVLKRPKYNFPSDVHISDDLPFIIGRIIYCNEPTLIDDAFQLCTDSEQTTWVITRLTDSFARSGNISSVKAVLNKLKPSETENLCASVCDLIECYDNLKPNLSRNIVQNYPLVLNLLGKRSSEKQIEMCRNFLKIKEDFCPDVRLEHLQNPRKKQRLLDMILTDVALQLSQGVLNVRESMKRCVQISALLGETETNVMVEFCQKLNNGFDSIVKFIDGLCLDESSSENLCLMAVLIMKSVNSRNLQLDASFCQQEGDALIKIDTYSLGLELAQKLSVLAILRSNPNDIGACIPVYNWVMSTFFSRNKSNSNLLEKCPNPGLLGPGFGAFQSFQFIFNAFTQLAVGYKNPDLKYLTHFDNRVNRLTEEQFIETVARLPSLTNNLCMEGHSLTASKLIVTLKSALLNFGGANPKISEALEDILINRCVPQVLQKLFSTRNIDIECAYILLINSKQRNPFMIIRNYLQVNKRNVQKLAMLAKLALRIMEHQGMGTTGSEYIKIVLLSKWWQKISECQLSLKEFFTTSSKSELMAKLIKHRHLNLEMLTEFCVDFDLDLQTSYIAYLKVLLTKWTPDYITIEDEFGEAKVTVKNDEEQLFKACGEVIELIDDKESVGTAVNNFYHSINFYHYEVFMCVFKIWRTLKKNIDSTKKMMLLSFLRTYKRVKAPNTPEIEEWFSAFPNSQSIDPLSQWRLPFTHTLFTKDVWKIIRPELTLKTYTIWFDVVRILDETLNKDDICIYAIKEVVSSGVLKENSTRGRNLFEEIDTCVTNFSNYEKATSAVYHLLSQTPEGADQVIAAKLCLKYASLYKEQYSESDPSVLDAFKKVTGKYLYILGSQILRKYQLTEDEYIKMLLHSHDLIDALYMDGRLLRKAYDCPDINKAVDELGALFKIDVQEKRVQLIEGYLSELNTSNVSLSLNSSWSCEFNTENNIKRALYICQSGELTHWQNFLLEKGFCETKSLSFRANALKCMCAISDPESVKTLTNTSYSAIINHIEKMSILSDLQSLGFSIDIEQLDKHKMVLLKRLAQNLDNPLSIKAMTFICIKYEVDELQYWEKIVKSSIKHLLHQNLRHSLNFLKTVSNVRHRKIYTDAWQTVIDHSFSVLASIKEDIYNTCIENILLLQSCPVLFALDLKKAFKSCCEFQVFEFAAIILQYLQEADQLECAKEILQSNRESLLMDIKNLSMRGIWGTSCVLDLLCSVIDSSRIE